MKVLLYDNRKIDPFGWDISTKEKERAGFLALFNYLDKVWKCYGELERYKEELKKMNLSLNELENVASDLPEIREMYKEKIEDLEKAKKHLEEMKWHHTLLLKARKGDAVSANYLLSNRTNHECERWQIIEIHDPLEKKKKNGEAKVKDDKRLIEKEDWKKAPGVIVEEGNMYSALAPRDYKIECNARYTIIEIKGYWIWWCSAHHQPLTHCQEVRAQMAEVERLKREKGK